MSALGGGRPGQVSPSRRLQDYSDNGNNVMTPGFYYISGRTGELFFVTPDKHIIYPDGRKQELTMTGEFTGSRNMVPAGDLQRVIEDLNLKKQKINKQLRFVRKIFSESK